MSQGWFDEMWMHRDAKENTNIKKQATITHMLPMGDGLATNAFFVRGVCYQVIVYEKPVTNGVYAALTSEGICINRKEIGMGMVEAKAMPNTLLGFLRSWLNERTDW